MDIKLISERPRLVCVVSDAILAMMVEEDLKPGDQLPSQEELGKKLGVSRASLREGVQRLVALEAIDVESGKRMTVGPALADGMVVKLNVQTLDVSLQYRHAMELGQTRTWLETEAAVEAVRQATESDVKELGRIVDEMGRAKDRGSLYRLNMDFHVTLARGSGNGMTAQLVRSLTAKFVELLGEIAARVPGYPPGVTDIDAHRAIYLALKRRDADEMRRLMEVHCADSGRPVLSALLEAQARK